MTSLRLPIPHQAPSQRRQRPCITNLVLFPLDYYLPFPRRRNALLSTPFPLPYLCNPIPQSSHSSPRHPTAPFALCISLPPSKFSQHHAHCRSASLFQHLKIWPRPSKLATRPPHGDRNHSSPKWVKAPTPIITVAPNGSVSSRRLVPMPPTVVDTRRRLFKSHEINVGKTSSLAPSLHAAHVRCTLGNYTLYQLLPRSHHHKRNSRPISPARVSQDNYASFPLSYPVSCPAWQ